MSKIMTPKEWCEQPGKWFKHTLELMEEYADYVSRQQPPKTADFHTVFAHTVECWPKLVTQDNETVKVMVDLFISANASKEEIKNICDKIGDESDESFTNGQNSVLETGF